MSQSPEGGTDFLRDFLSFKKVKKGFIMNKSYWKTYYFILESKSKTLSWYKGRDRREVRGSLTFTNDYKITLSKTEPGVILIYNGTLAKSSSSFGECIELGCNTESMKQKWLKGLLKSIKNIDIDQQQQDINLLLDLLPEELLAQKDPPLPTDDFPNDKFNLNPRINNKKGGESESHFDSSQSQGSTTDDDYEYVNTSTDIFQKRIPTNNNNNNYNNSNNNHHLPPPSLMTIAEDDISETTGTESESPSYSKNSNDNNSNSNNVRFNINQPGLETASNGFVESNYLNDRNSNNNNNNNNNFALGDSLSQSLLETSSNDKNIPKLERIKSGGVRMEFNGCTVTAEALNKMKESLEMSVLVEKNRNQSDGVQIFRTPENERHRGGSAFMSLVSAPHPATRLRRRQYISDASQDYKSLDTASDVTEFIDNLKQHLGHLKEMGDNDRDPVLEALIHCHIEPGCEWAALINAIHFLEDSYVKSAELLRADGWYVSGDDQPSNRLLTCALAFSTGKQLHFDLNRNTSLQGILENLRLKAGDIGVGTDFLESSCKAEWESLRNPLLDLLSEYSSSLHAAESLLLHQEYRYAEDHVHMNDTLDKQKSNYNTLRREYNDATRSLKHGGRAGTKDSKEKQMEISRLLEEKQEMTKRFNEEREKLIKENRQIRMALHPDTETAAASIKQLERRVEESEKRLLESNRRLVVLGGIPVTEDWEVGDVMTRSTAANASLAGASNAHTIKGLTMAHLEGEHADTPASKENSLFNPQRWIQHFHASKAGDDIVPSLHSNALLGSSTSTTHATVASSNNNASMNRKVNRRMEAVLQAPPSYARTMEIQGSDSKAGDEEFLYSKGLGSSRTRKMFDFDQRMQRMTVSHPADQGQNRYTHGRILNPPFQDEKLSDHHVNNNTHYASNIEHHAHSQLSRSGDVDNNNDRPYSALHSDEHNPDNSLEQRMRRILNLSGSGGGAAHHSNYELKMDDFRTRRHGGFRSPTTASKGKAHDKSEKKPEKGFKFSQYSLNDPLVGNTHYGGTSSYVNTHT